MIFDICPPLMRRMRWVWWKMRAITSSCTTHGSSVASTQRVLAWTPATFILCRCGELDARSVRLLFPHALMMLGLSIWVRQKKLQASSKGWHNNLIHLPWAASKGWNNNLVYLPWAVSKGRHNSLVCISVCITICLLVQKQMSPWTYEKRNEDACIGLCYIYVLMNVGMYLLL